MASDKNIVLKGHLLAAEIAAQREAKPRFLYRIVEHGLTGEPTLYAVQVLDATPKKFEVPRVHATNFHGSVHRHDDRFAYTPAGAWVIFGLACLDELERTRKKIEKLEKCVSQSHDRLTEIEKE